MVFLKVIFPLLLLLAPVFVLSQELAPRYRGERIRHAEYSLDYAENYEQPYWVYYTLTKARLNGTAVRKNNFRVDPLVSSGSAELADYKGSGYDRGHLCPAADMKFSEEAMSETFFLSNISPQVPEFNRGCWAQLEKFVRDKVDLPSDTLHVITGPVFLGGYKTIGNNKVAVPHLFFKVLYSTSYGMTAFLMPNTNIKGPLSSWVVSVDLVEELTGIDFFYQLPPHLQDSLEYRPNLWN